MIDEERFPGRQGRLLFAYLVAEQGRPVPRDELAEALWGEATAGDLGQGADGDREQAPRPARGRGIDGASALTGAFGCYRLDLPEGTWVDVIAAARRRAGGGGSARGRRPRAGKGSGRAGGVTGAPAVPARARTERGSRRSGASSPTSASRALSVLADACLRSGDAREAAKWAEQTIALAPFRETGYRRLMEAHVAAGNRAEALRVYEQCRRLLADELGAYPSPETESIYRALLEAPQPLRLERRRRSRAGGRTR